MSNNLSANEEIFHDEWANQQNLDSIDVIHFNTAITSPELRWIHSSLGDVKDKKIIDLGSGFGEVGIYLAIKGAHVTCADLSSSMLEKAKTLARQFGKSISTVKINANHLSDVNEVYDIIYAGNLLHHVNIHKIIPQIKNILNPNGYFVSWDPLAYNPIINIYRKIATQVRTIDEHPMTINDVNFIKSHFKEFKTKHFWFFTLFIFIIMYFIQFRNPNKERFWKIVVSESKRWSWLYRPLATIDDFILKIFPPLKWLCWNIVLICKNPK